MISKYTKAAAALVGALAMWFVTKSPEFTGAAVLAAFGVFWVPESEQIKVAKLWVGALVLGAGVLIPLLHDGFQTDDVWPVVVTVLTAAGVLLPNKDPNAPEKLNTRRWADEE